jgi:putative spermidine/putrescine transport system substrate-binding protein
VRQGKATIAFTSNGHAFVEQARNGSLGVIWDGEVLHPSYFAIPRSVSNEALAKEFIAFASRPEQLVGLVRQIPYGPMRRSAIAGALGVRHAVTGQELGPFLPTAPENLRTAVRFNPAWWEANAERIETALRIVRQGPPLPQRP